eukprot:GHVN01035151.1.p1 GENE.GHVN01035151.1~~GHVN01035151.1.p1  ORF type:complete len:964 (+),score=142.90 GHVN01035151.1:70-2961(+)
MNAQETVLSHPQHARQVGHSFHGEVETRRQNEEDSEAGTSCDFKMTVDGSLNTKSIEGETCESREEGARESRSANYTKVRQGKSDERYLYHERRTADESNAAEKEIRACEGIKNDHNIQKRLVDVFVQPEIDNRVIEEGKLDIQRKATDGNDMWLQPNDVSKTYVITVVRRYLRRLLYKAIDKMFTPPWPAMQCRLPYIGVGVYHPQRDPLIRLANRPCEFCEKSRDLFASIYDDDQRSTRGSEPATLSTLSTSPIPRLDLKIDNLDSDEDLSITAIVLHRCVRVWSHQTEHEYTPNDHHISCNQCWRKTASAVEANTTDKSGPADNQPHHQGVDFNDDDYVDPHLHEATAVMTLPPSFMSNNSKAPPLEKNTFPAVSDTILLQGTGAGEGDAKRGVSSEMTPAACGDVKSNALETCQVCRPSGAPSDQYGKNKAAHDGSDLREGSRGTMCQAEAEDGSDPQDSEENFDFEEAANLGDGPPFRAPPGNDERAEKANGPRALKEYKGSMFKAQAEKGGEEDDDIEYVEPDLHDIMAAMNLPSSFTSGRPIRPSKEKKGQKKKLDSDRLLKPRHVNNQESEMRELQPTLNQREQVKSKSQPTVWEAAGRWPFLSHKKNPSTKTQFEQRQQKYYSRRHELFPNVPGARLKESALYESTPYSVAREMASRLAMWAHEERQWSKTRCKNTLAVDLCCGVGCDTIQLAHYFDSVIAIDSSPEAIKCAKKNAKLCRVDNKIKFVCMECQTFLAQPNEALPDLGGKDFYDCIYFSPPWGGPMHSAGISSCFSVWNVIDINIPSLFVMAKRVARTVGVFLPKQQDLLELIHLACLAENQHYLGTKHSVTSVQCVQGCARSGTLSDTCTMLETHYQPVLEINKIFRNHGGTFATFGVFTNTSQQRAKEIAKNNHECEKQQKKEFHHSQIKSPWGEDYEILEPVAPAKTQLFRIDNDERVERRYLQCSGSAFNF